MGPKQRPEAREDAAGKKDQEEANADAEEAANEPEEPEEREFKSKFELLEPLGSGTFGDVYNGFDRSSKTFVAIKVEKTTTTKRGSLEKENERYFLISSRLDAKLLRNLPKLSERAFAKIFGFFKTHKKSYLVMEKLGPSLETLLQQCNRRFSLKTVCQIGIQMVDRIEALHAIRMIHRDIKPDNFVIGCQEDPQLPRNFIRIIDFGLSRDYISQETGHHVPEVGGRELVGTVRYVSIRVHDGIEQSRRDDIEAIVHVLIYFLKSLPW